MSLSNTFVVLMGLGIVFFGLICIVFLCQITSFICKSMIKETPNVVAPRPSNTNTNEVIPNRQEFVAAVSAAIAEELGTDVSGIKICSIKKLS